MLWSRLAKTPKYQDGFMQGYFRYFKQDGTMEEILAIDGKLYKDGLELPISGLASFQSTRQIEGVQYKGVLYIATGTKLVQYDGVTASVVTPYKPEPLEALYIGTNALADDPENYLTDGVSSVLQINGVKPAYRYGISNKDNSFTVFVSKQSGATIQYRLQWKINDDDAWTLGQDWTTSNTLVLKNPIPRDYQLRFTVRPNGSTNVADEVESLLPRYTVKELNENKTEDTTTIHQCNRILLHWERTILYGDPNQKDMIYVSDVGRPDYVPTLNTLRFENNEQEGLTTLIKFRDMLVAFTPHTVQGLFGKSPYDFSRLVLSTSVGCIAPYSPAVFENYVSFLSLEGLYILKSVGYSETRVNVQKIDGNINNILPRDTDACAVVSDGQYQIVFPSRNQRFRLYYQRGVWTRDESPKLNFSRLYEFSGEVFGQSASGTSLLRMCKDCYDDDGYVYADKYIFKDYDFGEPYNPKKLKELQILLGQVERTALSLWVYADGSELISPDTSYASVNSEGVVEWNEQSTPNLQIESGTVFGSWILGKSTFGNVESGIYYVPLSGKCRRVRLEIEHKEPKPNTVLGLGYIFKLRKP